MNVFDLHQTVIKEYQDYVKSFYSFNDKRIEEFVDARLQDGVLWPEPLIQLNPAYKSGGKISDLVAENILHKDCDTIFRLGKSNGATGKDLILYQHQKDAILAAKNKKNYVLTTGTSSGKSLSYIIPIVDYVLNNPNQKGIKAVVIYPMNALANSQKNELEKFLGKENPKVTFRRYTGQENQEEKDEIRKNPPDILLTNYVMLELVLTRTNDNNLIKNMKGNLKFLVLDELHTYRGRQGADVSMLIRRLKDICNADDVLCIGTSATMGGGETWDEKRKTVAEVSSLIFGSRIEPDYIIGETLDRATKAYDLKNPENIHALRDRVNQVESPKQYKEFSDDILASWVENEFGLKEEAGGRLVRTMPRALVTDESRQGSPIGAADDLARLTDLDRDTCASAIKNCLMLGSAITNEITGKPVFAFRLHQFISRGETVNTTIEDPEIRSFTLSWQQYAPGTDQTEKKVLMPLSFCRCCGQAYYQVYKNEDEKGINFSARGFYDREDNDNGQLEKKKAGYLYLSNEAPWPEENADEFWERLPEELSDKRSMGKYWPVKYNVNPDGRVSSTGIITYFVPQPFRFCLNCGVSYAPSQKKDYSKLAQLSSEGRSTATTILSLSTVRWLRENKYSNIAEKAKKILSFTDNRQDASLQAGHFNDFIGIGLLRAGLYKAAIEISEGLTYDIIASRVLNAMNLPISEYANAENSDTIPPVIARSIRTAFMDVLSYRLFHDLKRGWRVNMPNLEQCGLLKIEYMGLDDICDNNAYWQGKHELLVNAAPEARNFIARTLLDYMRKHLAIEAECLIEMRQDEIRRKSWTSLKDPWAIGDERMESASIFVPRAKDKEIDMEQGRYSQILFMSPKGNFGKFLSRQRKDIGWEPRINNKKISIDDRQVIINDLFSVMLGAGILVKCKMDTQDGVEDGYRINAQSMIWKAYDESIPEKDPLISPSSGKANTRINSFFIKFYKQDAACGGRIIAAEHTAQVPAQDRMQRESDFSEAKLPVLFCSPTMELGVDISDLNVVGLRNVPPTPANYAQRSGRAGRNGQPALVITYCTTGSPHDQYFFRRIEDMVSGQVMAPRLELANEDLLISHIHAIWLQEAHLDLGKDLGEILEVAPDSPRFLKFKQKVLDVLSDEYIKANTISRVKDLFSKMQQEFGTSFVFKDEWAEKIVKNTDQAFYEATERWRNMFRAAINQMDLQHKIQKDNTRTAKERARAKELYNLAVAQKDLLLDTTEHDQSDFNSYRYFACEGFLPGYNFPRLPISAFVGYKENKGRTYLSRPRFLAITEFGPQSVIYHEGTHFAVTRVMLPIEINADQIPTRIAKLCNECGYINQENMDCCTRCGTKLDPDTIMRYLFRMENVIAKRKERITADEEERQRKGYEIRTVLSFADKDMSYLKSSVTLHSEPLLEMEYGSTANIWRVNVGWRTRKNRNEYGYGISIEDGRWVKSQVQKEEDPDEDDDAAVRRTQIVVPYVEDRRNSLIIRPARPLSDSEMASLQAALKVAIQAVYQLEDNELAAEPLPSPSKRNYILLYEAAEGGAGVLRHLVEDSDAIRNVAEKALEICHFDEDGNDIHRARHASEDCVNACYDCLLSYSNQMDHSILNRHSIRDLLLELLHSNTQAPYNTTTPDIQYEFLRTQCTTQLEELWLKCVYESGYRLPDEAQKMIESCATRPDFFYNLNSSKVAVYIDGPVHERVSNMEHDKMVDERLLDAGYFPIRFSDKENWWDIFSENSNVFGFRKDEYR